MSLRNHTGIIARRLSGNGGGEVQTFAKGQPMSWLLRTLPKLSKDGTKLNYLLGFMVTIVGSYTSIGVPSPGCYGNWKNPGSVDARGNIRTMWDTIRSLIDSVELRSAWHGTALSSLHVKGSMLQLLEFVGNGLERPFRQRPPLYGGEGQGTEYFRYSFFLPTCVLAGPKGHHTALPVPMYKDAELVINARATLSPWSGAGSTVEIDTLGATTFQVSALLLPDAEVRVGPGIEWVDYAQAVNGNAFDIAGLGTTTTLSRVHPGAGLAGLFWLSSRNGLPGPGMVRDIGDIAVPFLDLPYTQHLDPVITQFENFIGGVARPLGPITAADDGDGDPADGATDIAGFPYDDLDKGTGPLGSSSAEAQLPPNPVVLALKLPPKDFETSKIDYVEGSEHVQMSPRNGVTFAGSHHLLALQYRKWTEEGFTSAKQTLIESGVCRAVLHTDDVDWSIKTLRKQNPLAIEEYKRELFPMVLKPVATARVSVSS